MKLENVRNSIDKVPGWLGFKEIQFLYEQAKNTKNGVIVEIGSFKGKSTIALAGGSLEGSSVKIYAIDPHMTDVEQKFFNQSESSFESFKKNITDAGVALLVEPIVALSQDAVKTWNKPIGFLWIDGDHSYKGAKLDFDLWAPFVLDGGVVAYHDSFGLEVQQVLSECMFNSPHFSDTGILGSIAFGTWHTKQVSLVQRVRNRFIFILITGYRIINEAKLPTGFRNLINSVGGFFLKTIQSR